MRTLLRLSIITGIGFAAACKAGSNAPASKGVEAEPTAQLADKPGAATPVGAGTSTDPVKTNSMMITKDGVGPITEKTKHSVDAIRALFPNDNVDTAVTKTEGDMLNGGTSQKTVTVKSLGLEIYADGKTIEIHSANFSTTHGFKVGDTLGQLAQTNPDVKCYIHQYTEAPPGAPECKSASEPWLTFFLDLPRDAKLPAAVEERETVRHDGIEDEITVSSVVIAPAKFKDVRISSIDWN